MTALVQLLISGVLLGGIYALAAFNLALIFGVCMFSTWRMGSSSCWEPWSVSSWGMASESVRLPPFCY